MDTFLHVLKIVGIVFAVGVVGIIGLGILFFSGSDNPFR